MFFCYNQYGDNMTKDSVKVNSSVFTITFLMLLLIVLVSGSSYALIQKNLIGKHSYKVFVSGDRDNYNSEIYKIIFKKEKDILTITFEGKSFYRYMVRNMIGALLLVGCGKISIEEFKNMIDSDENKYTYITVPSNGLYLESVEY